MREPFCDRCSTNKEKVEAVYELWCYTEEKLNPYAQGTASAGLMQRRTLCNSCTDKMIDLGLTKAKK